MIKWINNFFFHLWWGKDAFYIVTTTKFNKNEIYSSTLDNKVVILRSSKDCEGGFYTCIAKRFEE